MLRFLISLSGILFLILVTGCSDLPSKKLTIHSSLSSHLQKICEENEHLLPSNHQHLSRQFYHQLDSAAQVILSDEVIKNDPQKQIDEMRRWVFSVWQLKFTHNQNDIQSILPHLVFNKKSGSCLGLSLTFLLLAEKTNIPLFGVLAPGHFFVRYDNGTFRCNIETLRNGECMSETWYKNRYQITDSVLYNLSSLDIPSVLSAIHYNTGNYYLEKSLYNEALIEYRKSLKLNKQNVAAQGNLAISLTELGKIDAALKILLKIENTYPKLNHLHKNIGTIYLKKKNYMQAINQYSLALEKSPHNPEILYGLGVAYFHLSEYGKSHEMLEKLKKYHPHAIETEMLHSVFTQKGFIER